MMTIEYLEEYLEEYYARRKDSILRSGETNDENGVFCPYCAHEQSDLWEGALDFGGEETEMDCGSCEKKFFVVVSVVYSTRKEEDEND